MNRVMRKITSWLVSFCLIATCLPVGAFASSETFVDMPSEDHWAYAALSSAISNGILNGDESGHLNPNGLATRAQVAAIINRVFGAQVQADISYFSDVDSSRWYYADMAKAVQMQTFVGDGRTLDPDSYITREQTFTVFARALRLESADNSVLAKFNDCPSVSLWATESLSAMVEKGYVNGNNGFINPKDNITRAEIAQLIYNVFQQYIFKAGAYTSVANGNVIVNTPDVVLKDCTVTGDLIIADGVGNGDITLDNVVVEGRMIVRGGGDHSIRITNGSNVGSIILSKTSSGGLRVLA